MTNAEPQENPTPETAEEFTQPASGADPRIAELEAKLAEMTDKTLRALAEADNIRKRGEKERQDTAKFSVSSFARDILPVADNLRRALLAITPEQREQNESLKNIFVGVEATERELLRVLEKNNIKKIEALGQKFDPNFHEVMFEAEIPGKEPGTVTQVLEEGYTIHDRILRPARVGVAKGSGDAPRSHQVDEEA
jgi:molecular chaperone GrpE